MPKHEIEATFNITTGESTFHVEGLKGTGCLAVLKKLEDAIGAAKTEPEPTTEMHETESTDSHHRA